MAASERMRVLCEDCSGYNTTLTVKDGKTVEWDVEDAIAFAVSAHAGQVYSGFGVRMDEPYILHLLRVMASVEAPAGYHNRARIAAVLHDVIEDTDAEIPPRALDPDVLFAITALARDKKTETYTDYIERVATSGALARAVKIADLRDNLAHDPPERLRTRYVAALERLGAPDTREARPADADHAGGEKSREGDAAVESPTGSVGASPAPHSRPADEALRTLLDEAWSDVGEAIDHVSAHNGPGRDADARKIAWRGFVRLRAALSNPASVREDGE